MPSDPQTLFQGPLDGLILAVGILVLLGTALPLIRRGWWWVRMWDFPRPQLALIGGAVLLAGPLVWPWTLGRGLFLGGVAIATGYQCWRVWPFTEIAPVQVLEADGARDDCRLRILVSNVLVGNREAGGLLDQVREHAPDLWLALEPDDWWVRELSVLDDDFIDGVERPQDNAYGIWFRSRLPLRHLELRCLIEPDVPSIRTEVQLRSGDWVTFYGLHPRPPHTFQASFSRDAELIVAGREIAAREHPVIVAGDFNDVPWSHACRLFQKVSGLLDPRLGRGLLSSFSARSRMMRWPLDHVMVDAGFQVVNLQRLKPFGSDHYPILATLAYRPGGADRQSPRAMQSGDHSAAETLLKRRHRLK